MTYGCGSVPTSASSPPAPATFSALPPSGKTPNSAINAGSGAFFFTTKSCSPGSEVGQLHNPPGLTCNFLSIYPNDHYTVLATGQIRLTTPTAATESLIIRSTCAPAGSATAMVTITSTCSPTSGAGGGGVPVFALPSYTFVLASCFPGQTAGSVVAANAIVYVIEPSSPTFTVVPTTGVIKSTAALTAAHYNFTVRAYSATLAVASTPVRIMTPRCVAPASAFKFYATSYAFAPTNCPVNAFIGQVGTTGGGGATSYSVDNPTGVYSVGFLTGVITAVGAPTAGTLTIRAMNAGNAVTVPVTVSLEACEATSSQGSVDRAVEMAGNPSSGGPVFGQKYYVFAAQPCSEGSVVGQGEQLIHFVQKSVKKSSDYPVGK